MMPNRISKDNPWEYIDDACWRGELLHLGEELSAANLTGDDSAVIDLVFRAEAGNLDGSDPKFGQLVERLGVSDSGAHSARAALGYARMSFFVGQWQNCLDALQQAAVTAIRDRDANLPALRRLRCEAYLRFADFWAVMRQPGYVVAYLTLAQQAYPHATVRILARARRLCANHGPASGALLKMAVEGLWTILFQCITDQDFDDLPEVHWPDAPSPEQIAADEGWLTAFEVCMVEALSTSGYSGRYWARTAVDFAEKMKSPGWLATADLVFASHAIETADEELAVAHLGRALQIIPEHHLEGLLVYAMLVNLPLEGQEGFGRAHRQAEEAITQVVSLAPLFRDLVSRRRFIWAHQEVFLKTVQYAIKSGQAEAALKALLEGQGAGLKAVTNRKGSMQAALEARNRETGPLLLGEEHFEPRSMRKGVFGPSSKDVYTAYVELQSRVDINDAIARSQALQLVREDLFEQAERTPVTLQRPQHGTLEIYFLTDQNETQRIDRWASSTKLTTLPIDSKEIRRSIESSGLSMTAANRSEPVDYAPIDAVLKKLLTDLPAEAVRSAEQVRIWPHGPLHFIPFTYAIRSKCRRAKAVTSLLAIEQRRTPVVANGPTIRLAPHYERGALLKSQLEVDETKQSGDVVIAGEIISAKAILELLFSSPSLFHFAGHAVNRNDHPELAGLYGSDLELVSAADILNLGTAGPSATVLSACETGPGALHSADGSFSLPRSFLQAGSEWVLASLWKVDDDETFQLMKEFFVNLRKGMSPESALAPSRHPFVVYRSI
jgi:CHAT domain